MPSVEKTVECDIGDFSDQDLIDEVKWRNLEDEFNTLLESLYDSELCEELENRGYKIVEKGNESIEYLYSTWLTCSRESFEQELKKFFRHHLGEYVK